MGQRGGANGQAEDQGEKVDLLRQFFFRVFGWEGFGMMGRRACPFGGGEHGGFPARLGLFGVVRQFPALPFERDDILHLGVAGFKFVDVDG